MNSFREKILRDIETHGVSLVGVASDGESPQFTYTIGLTARFGFEILVFGLPPHFAGYILNDVTQELITGGVIGLDAPDDRWANMPLLFKEANQHAHDYVVQADNIYGRDVRVLQMVLPDKEGHFPGDRAFDYAYMGKRQPVLYSV